MAEWVDNLYITIFPPCSNCRSKPLKSDRVCGISNLVAAGPATGPELQNHLLSSFQGSGAETLRRWLSQGDYFMRAFTLGVQRAYYTFSKIRPAVRSVTIVTKLEGT